MRIEVVNVKGRENVADGLTKTLQQQTFHDFVKSVGLVDISDQLQSQTVQPADGQLIEQPTTHVSVAQ